MKLRQLLMLAGFAAFSAMAADEPQPSTDAIQPRNDDKVSYALGMNMGAQIKRVGVDVNVDTIAQAVKDVLDGKPTRLQQEDIRPLLTQAQAYAVAKRKADGEAFLATNARADGVTTLPDGLQYKVLQAGTGELVKSNDIALVNLRGAWLDGREFLKQDHIQLMPLISPRGIRETLELMKPGAKWRIFVPSDLSYGNQMGQPVGFGSTLIYELELISAGPDPDHKAVIYGSGRLGHPPGEDFLPKIVGPKASAVAARPEPPRENPNIVFPGDTAK
jgi:FKBP-type peptidyl-prolyl cis-trans isomerase FklB